jgi:hypothetical protein
MRSFLIRLWRWLSSGHPPLTPSIPYVRPTFRPDPIPFPDDLMRTPE